MAPSLVTWPTSTSANCPAFASADQFEPAGADLRDGAGGAVDRVEPHGLDRVDDDQRGVLRLLQAGDDVADVDRGGEFDGGVGDAQAAGAQADLVDGLLAGDVADALAGPREAGGGLQQQGGFADARIAADQDGRGRHQAATQDAVEFLDADGGARRRGGGAVEADEGDAADRAFRRRAWAWRGSVLP